MPNILDEERCRAAVHEQTAPHTCPYRTEINEDYVTTCTCCDDCRNACNDEV